MTVSESYDIYLDGSQVIARGKISGEILDSRPSFESAECIQTALNMLSREGGGSIELERGTFLLNEPVIVGDRCEIKGKGKATQLVVAESNADGIGLIIKDARNSAIRNLAVRAEGNGSAIAGLIGDKVYLSPGRPGSKGRATDDVVQEFDFAKMNDGASAWRKMKSLPENPRTGYMSSWPVVNGKLYYIGGEDDSWTAKKYHHEFTPDASGGTWRRVTDYPITIHGVGPVAVGNKIYVCGGGKGGGVENKTSKVYVYTIKGVPTSAFKPVTKNRRAARKISGPALIFNSRGALVSFAANAAAPTTGKGLRKGVYLMRTSGIAKAAIIE